MGLLEGRVALVTGAAGWIGSATVEAMCEQGARVVLTDLNADGLQQTTERLKGQGYDVACKAGDLASEDDIRAVVAFATDTFGGLDILDNNAGATGLAREDPGIVDLSSELWDKIQTINSRGPMLYCKYALPGMLARGRGSIINISSGQSLSGDIGNTAYACGKAAVNALTRHLATAYGPQGIRVNAVAPGLIVDPSTEGRLPKAIQDLFIAHSLVPRLGVPRDIANMVVYLASDLSAFVTGQVISV
ncbi:MAG: short-chain dehydrogenase/reductase, partial [Phenylobacterium sp.]|nr:short-chain dehydrogenase/reductase [Phenylobacterium sp.]